MLVLDLNEEEADKLLASLDPLAAMAGKDDDLLRKYGFRGFPSFAALNAKGELLGRPRGRSIGAFEATF